ncbi:membrane-associated phospholipid phosphatase [Thermocatellispora tengchongensis]|uniref:Membrane-associated phospholipid phosphatase n=1 Tax=Thermocatellispora tengchongensis TaxID=1073253 RepID=A0A840P163_9ACTN|nr:phosphatase PAP2 family protein [Thermocatellispora tengchongensis]MBB5131673.1 membrane-associated phospholipid phosphatase [Thermocatellispora tengchongensis]
MSEWAEWFEGLHRAETGITIVAQEWLWWMGPLLWLVSALGADGTVLVALSAVYWCVSPRLGVRVGLAVLVSAGVNAVAKLAFHQPRPAWIDGRVRVLSGEGSFGMPSGHAQTSLVAGRVLVGGGRGPYGVPSAQWAAFGFVALVSVSRVYLGVHFVSDVLGGPALGALLLLVYERLGGPAARWWRARAMAVQLALSVAAGAVLLGGGALATLAHEGWSLPAAWREAGADDPGGMDRVVAMSGAVTGALAGASVMARAGWFSAAGPAGVRALRWLIGMAGAVLVWAAAGVLGETIAAGAVRYTLVALWVVLGAPLLFLRLGLARPREVTAGP